MIASAMGWNSKEKIEYSEICQTLQKHIRHDVRKHNNAEATKDIIQATNSAKRADKKTTS